MATVLAALIPVFLVIVLGVVLKRTLLPENSHWTGLERLTYFVLFPALLVVSIARADLAQVDVIGVGAALLGSMVLVALVVIPARVWLCRTLALSGPSYTSLVQGALRWNTYVGLAVIGGLGGPKGLAVAAVALAVLIPTLNIVSVIVLARHAGEGRADLRRIMMQLVRNPFIWACAAGAVINAFHLPLPPVLVTFGDILGKASLALGLLVVGAGLRVESARRPHAATYVSALLKLILMPVLAIGIAWLMGVSGIDMLVVAIAAAVPSAPNGYVLARQMGGDAPLLAEMLTVQTIFAALTMPVAIAAAVALAP